MRNQCKKEYSDEVLVSAAVDGLGAVHDRPAQRFICRLQSTGLGGGTDWVTGIGQIAQHCSPTTTGILSEIVEC